MTVVATTPVTSVRLREASYEHDVESIWRLSSRHFEEFRECSLPDFKALCRHRWLENPARSDAHVFGWVLERGEGGEIVGYLGLVPVRFKIGDRQVCGASGTGWVVSPACRAHSLRLYKTYMAWGDRHFLIDVTAGGAASGLHERLKTGMRRIPVVDFNQRMAWSPRPAVVGRVYFDRLAAKRASLRYWRFPARMAFAAGATLRFMAHRRLRFGPGNLSVERVTEVPPDFEAFWALRQQDLGVTVIRDRRFMQWRHFDLPGSATQSVVFTCRDRGELVGYASLFRRGTADAIPGHFVVTDALYDPGRPEIVRALLDCAFRWADDHGAVVVEVSGLAPKVMAEARRQRPLTFLSRTWTYWYKGPADVVEACSREPWWPSGIDGDGNMS